MAGALEGTTQLNAQSTHCQTHNRKNRKECPDLCFVHKFFLSFAGVFSVVFCFVFVDFSFICNLRRFS